MNIPDAQTLLIAIIAGLALGCVYALVAVAFNLVLAASAVFNLTIGAMISITVVVSYLLGSRMALPPIAVALIGMAIGGVAGWLSEIIAVRRFIRVATEDLSAETMVATLGLGLAGVALLELIFGSDIFPVQPYVSPDPFVVAGIPIRPIFLVMASVLVVVAGSLEAVARYTQLGIVTRAVIADPDGASLMGISVPKVIRGAFIVSGMLAALAGFLIAPITGASAFVGTDIMMFAFAAVALGGFASFRGSVVGGLLVGLVVGLTPAFVSPHWSNPLVFLLLVLGLFLKPAGLFGHQGHFGSVSTREV